MSMNVLLEMLLILVSFHQLEQSLQHNANLIGSSFVGQQSNYVQRLNYVNVKQHLLNNSPNVAPGWRRQLSEGEIVYFR